MAAALLLALNLPASVIGRVKTGVREAMAPVQGLLSSVARGGGETWRTVRGLGGLADHNKELSIELVRLQNRLDEARELERENVQLRNLLDFRARSEYRLEACEVIGRDISGWWQNVRVGLGNLSDVRPGQAVITSQGLVGRTLDVSPHTADVLLISDPSCRISAMIRRTGTFGVVSGRGVSWKGHPLCRMEFINKNTAVQPGDAVLTSGLGGLFPRGLLVGYVDKVYEDRSGLYQHAEIIPRADLDDLDYLFVIRREEALEQVLRDRISRENRAVQP